MTIKIPSKIQVQVVKAGWWKRSYQFMADSQIIGKLDYEKSYIKKATAVVQGKEFSIRRGGFWKHYIEISSASHEAYNMRFDVSWRSKISIMDADQNSFVFRSTGIWKSKWTWFNRRERPLIEIRSKNFSTKNCGLIDIKDPEMKDCLFWIMVSWFVILCSEADAASASAV